jgi:hypothetical protein
MCYHLGKYGAPNIAQGYIELFNGIWTGDSIARFSEKDIQVIDEWLCGAWDGMLDYLRVKDNEDDTPLLLLDRDYKGEFY